MFLLRWSRTPGKVMKSFIPSTCGCVHLQHTILCTWEASSLTIGCTWTVVTSPARTLAHTHSVTQTDRRTTGQAFSGDQKLLTRALPDLVSHPLWYSFCLSRWTQFTVLWYSCPCKHHESYSPGSGAFFFSLDSLFFCSPSYRRIRRGCGGIGLLTTHRAEFCDFSVQTWSLTFWKKEGGVTLTKNQIIPPSPYLPCLSTCSLLKQQAKHSFIIPTGKSLWQLRT